MTQENIPSTLQIDYKSIESNATKKNIKIHTKMIVKDAVGYCNMWWDVVAAAMAQKTLVNFSSFSVI